MQALNNTNPNGNDFGLAVSYPDIPTVAEGKPIHLKPSVKHSGGVTVAFSATGLPAGVTINAGTGVVSGDTTTAGTGNLVVTAVASDGQEVQLAPIPWVVEA